MKSKSMVLASGTGYLGQVLIRHFKDDYTIYVLTRGQNRESDGIHYLHWDGKSKGDWENAINGCDVLINLTGRSVDCRYTEKNKQEILMSRLDATNILSEVVSSCSNPPKLWINSSSATIYPDELQQANTELSEAIGNGFSEDVCRQWEAAFYQRELPATRRVAARITIVLGKTGGALKPVLMLTKLGAGGRQGSGNQMFSWIHEEDYARAIGHIIEYSEIEGAVNMAAPNPVTNAEFMKSVRKALGVPFGFPAPKWLLEIGTFFMRTESELVLKSRFVISDVLEKSGFKFLYPSIDEALNEAID